MRTVDERVAVLEGRVQEQSRIFTDLREGMVSLERRMESRFAQVDARFAQIDRQFETIRAEMAANFKWVVGIQLTTLIAIVAALLRR
jgi:hypothetical protein